MTPENALFLLNLTDGADAEAIKTKYNELYSDYQMRLTNAPTPNLKKLYQKNLQELEEARDLLLTGGEVVNKYDLPSASPTFEVRQAAPSPLVERPVTPPRQPTVKSTPAGSNGIWIVATIVGLAVAVLLGILWYQSRTEQESLQQQLARYKPYEDLLKNSKLTVKNLGSRPLTVEALTVMYLDPNNQFKKYEGNVGDVLEPGRSRSYEKVNGSELVWNGDVVYYVVHLNYGGTRISQAGLYRQDYPEGVIQVNFDNLLQ